MKIIKNEIEFVNAYFSNLNVKCLQSNLLNEEALLKRNIVEKGNVEKEEISNHFGLKG